MLAAGLLAASALDAGAQEAARVSACRFAAVAAGTVVTIRDGRSFVLDDGREVRLAAIEVPALAAGGETGTRSAAGAAARTALDAILAGQQVELRQQGAATDRYGRTVAHAYLVRDGVEISAGHHLLGRGLARVTAHVGHSGCAAELLAQEQTARTARLGLWAEQDYAVLEAGRGAALLAARGRFAVVEGKVLSVRESGGTIYVNFGRRWSEALTVTISKRHERIFTGAGIEPGKLAERRVRVRGWVEERNGPRIEAARPEQIEMAERN